MSKGSIRRYMDIENIACLDITECGLRNLGQYFESSALSLADNNSMLYHRKNQFTICCLTGSRISCFKTS